MMSLPYYHLTQHSPCPLPQPTTIGGELPLWTMGARQQQLRLARGSADSATTIGGELPFWTMGARQQHLRLARGSADSGCLRDRRYLHTHTRAGRGGRRSKEMGGHVDLFVCVCTMMSCISVCVCEFYPWCMYVCLCACHFLCVFLCVYVRVYVVLDSLRELA